MENIIKFKKVKEKDYIHQGGGYMCTILKKIKDKKPIELLEEYEISQSPPIDISKLLENIGISTIAKDFSHIEDISRIPRGTILGAAFSNGEHLAIFYKKSDSIHRKKFTIAHELAHCCLHCKNYESSHIEYRFEPFFNNLEEEEYEKERSANVFAGQLLIPKKSLLEYYERMLVPSLKDLAKIFDVSASVMAARLDYLNMPYFKDTVTEIII